jgi:hypothetical protein
MDRLPLDSGRVYTVASSIAALTAAPTEVVSLIASSLSRVDLLKLELGQRSTGGVAAMAVDLFAATSAALGGSTGVALTPINRERRASAPASTCSILAESTTPNSTAAAVRVAAGTFDTASGKYNWEPPLPVVLDPSQRFAARISALTTAQLGGLTMTLTFRELGKTPSS